MKSIGMNTDRCQEVISRETQTVKELKAVETQIQDVYTFSKKAKEHLCATRRCYKMKESMTSSILNHISLNENGKIKAISFINDVSIQKYRESKEDKILEELGDLINKEIAQQEKPIALEKTYEQTQPVDKTFIISLVLSDTELNDQEKNTIISKIEQVPQDVCNRKGEDWLIEGMQKLKKYLIESDRSFKKGYELGFNDGAKQGFNDGARIGFDDGSRKGIEFGIDEGIKMSQAISQPIRYNNQGFFIRPNQMSLTSPLDFFRNDQQNPLNQGGSNLFGDEFGNSLSNIFRR